MTHQMREALDKFCASWDCGCTDCHTTQFHFKACAKVFAAGAKYATHRDSDEAVSILKLLSLMVCSEKERHPPCPRCKDCGKCLPCRARALLAIQK